MAHHDHMITKKVFMKKISYNDVSTTLANTANTDTLIVVNNKLNELALRHRSQIKSIHKSNNTFCSELTLKISKYVEIAKVVGEENAVLKEGIRNLELFNLELTAERNELATENSILGAKWNVLFVGRITAENNALKEEIETLTQENAAMRDAYEGGDGVVAEQKRIIEGLCERLKFAMSNNNNSSSKTEAPQYNNHESDGLGGGKAQSAMLVKTLGNAARTAMQQVEICRKQFAHREKVLLERIEELEVRKRVE